MKKFRYFWQFAYEPKLPAKDRLSFLRVNRNLSVDKVICSPNVWPQNYKMDSLYKSREPKYIWQMILHSERDIVRIAFRANWSNVE